MSKMMKVVCLLFVAACLAAADDSLLEGTQLELTLLVHRHGDRTPVESTLSFSTDPDKLEELSAPYGYEQLTEKGVRRAYDLGVFLRQRYNELLAPQYNSSEVYIRSTDITRTKMSVLAALAAIYPPGARSWSRELNWTPVPYTTVPEAYDWNLATSNCATFVSAYTSLLMSQNDAMTPYFDVLNLISETIGFNVTGTGLVYAVYDVFTSQINLGLPLTPELEAVLPEISEAAGAAIDIVFGNENYIALQAGVLLNEFYTYAAEVKEGTDTERVRIYSAHDINVFSLLKVTQVGYNLGVPKYSSMYALELRKVVETGEYVVLPVYLPSPEEEVVYLQVDGCDTLCPLDQFIEITSPYALDEDTWTTKCSS